MFSGRQTCALMNREDENEREWDVPMTEDQNKSVEENNENAKARASLPEKFVLYNYKNFSAKQHHQVAWTLSKTSTYSHL